MKIPLCKPYYDSREWKAAKDVITSGMVASGKVADEFDQALARFCGVKYAVSTNSCTSALQLALIAYGIREGEVITSDFTFTSSAMVVNLVGACPCLVDVELETKNINPYILDVNESTRAIIPVDYGGHPCEYDLINAIARKEGIPVIADAAHSLGAKYRRHKVGGLCDISCFSFHGTKNLAIGEGGALTTNDSEVYEKLLFLRDCGTTAKEGVGKTPWRYSTVHKGMSVLMSDICAAVGLVQLDKMKKINKLRRENSRYLTDLLSAVEDLVVPFEHDYVESNHHLYTILVDEEVRDEFILRMGQLGIQCDVHYLPLHMHPFYGYYASLRGEYDVSRHLFSRLVTLPMFPSMTEKELNHIAFSVENTLYTLSKKGKKADRGVRYQRGKIRRRGGLAQRLSGCSPKPSVRGRGGKGK